VKEKTYKKVKAAGHWIGMGCLLTGFYFFFKNGFVWAFFLGFFAYWIINYILIRGLIENSVSEGSTDGSAEN